MSMLLVFYFLIIHSFVYGQFTNKHNLNSNSISSKNNNEEKTTEVFRNERINKTTQKEKTPDEQCPPDETLHHEKDFKFLINNLYKQLSIDEQLNKVYKSQTQKVRDNYTEELQQFIEWYQHKPEHLKHLLDGLGQVRLKYIEKVAKKTAKMLKSVPNLETIFKNKNTTMRKLIKKHKRYEAMCTFNCEDTEDQKIFKREVRSDYYCSSLEDLNNRITKKLQNAKEQLKTQMVNQLTTKNKNYKTAIDKIKNNLTDKALQNFAKTMYNILALQDEYYHFVENITNIETKILSIQEINIQIDNELLVMQKAVEKYGQYCRNCGDGLRIRRAIPSTEKTVKKPSEKILDRLIDEKFNATNVEIKKYWDNIFDDLNDIIRKMTEDINVAPINSIQEDIVKMIKQERQELNKLKTIVPRAKIKQVLGLVKKSQDLLKNIGETIRIEPTVQITNTSLYDKESNK